MPWFMECRVAEKKRVIGPFRAAVHYRTSKVSKTWNFCVIHGGALAAFCSVS